MDGNIIDITIYWPSNHHDAIWEKNKTVIKKRVILITLSFLFAHDPDNEKIFIDDFIRIGFVSNPEIAQNGLGSFYRLKRVTNNTFRDFGSLLIPYSPFFSASFNEKYL